MIIVLNFLCRHMKLKFRGGGHMKLKFRGGGGGGSDARHPPTTAPKLQLDFLDLEK